MATPDIAVNCVTSAVARTPGADPGPYRLHAAPHSVWTLPGAERGRGHDRLARRKENSFTTGAVFDLSGGRATY